MHHAIPYQHLSTSDSEFLWMLCQAQAWLKILCGYVKIAARIPEATGSRAKGKGQQFVFTSLYTLQGRETRLHIATFNTSAMLTRWAERGLTMYLSARLIVKWWEVLMWRARDSWAEAVQVWNALLWDEEIAERRRQSVVRKNEQRPIFFVRSSLSLV